jgi:flagellar motor switch protein FliM
MASESLHSPSPLVDPGLPRVLSQQQKRVLERAGKRLASGIPRVLAGHHPGMSLFPLPFQTDTVIAGAFLDTLPDPSPLAVLEVSVLQAGMPCLLLAEKSLFDALVDSAFGGKGMGHLAPVHTTPMAHTLAERLFCSLTRLLPEAFRPFCSTWGVKRYESSPPLALVTHPETPCARILFRMTVHETQPGTLQLLLPLAVLSDLCPEDPPVLRTMPHNVVWQTHLSDLWRTSTMSVRNISSPVSMPLGEILGWQKGSRIACPARFGLSPETAGHLPPKDDTISS